MRKVFATALLATIAISPAQAQTAGSDYCTASQNYNAMLQALYAAQFGNAPEFVQVRGYLQTEVQLAQAACQAEQGQPATSAPTTQQGGQHK